MRQSGEITDAELPSAEVQLADKYRQLGETTAKVALQKRTKTLAAIRHATELCSDLGRSTGELIDTFVEDLPQWFLRPDTTAARIVAGSRVAESTDFESTADPLTYETAT